LDLYEAAHPDAVCFQLDSVPEPRELNRLVDRVLSIGACASPVIETVGTGPRPPLPKARVRELLDPLFPKIGMVTIQAAETAARSNQPAGALAADSVHSYLECLKPGFHGTIQLQGGITIETIGSAVGAGAEFLVCGSQIFRNTLGLEPESVIARLLREAALVLPARFSPR
jgi:pentose-5-phosphate-3-epimerase